MITPFQSAPFAAFPLPRSIKHGRDVLGLTARAEGDADEDLGLLDARGGWNGLEKPRQQGLGDGEELRGLGGGDRAG